MKISDVMRSKGTAVVTVSPRESVATLLDLLAQHNIGAVVVSSDGHEVAGIVSERDIVRRLQSRGAEAFTVAVAEIKDASYALTPGRFVGVAERSPSVGDPRDRIEVLRQQLVAQFDEASRLQSQVATQFARLK